FRLTGNPLTLRAGIISVGDNTWAINSTLNKALSFTNVSGTFTFAGTLNNGGNLLTLVANNAIQMSGAISGAGGINKLGPGTATLSTANTFAGPATVTAGTFALLGPGTVPGSPQVT